MKLKSMQKKIGKNLRAYSKTSKKKKLIKQIFYSKISKVRTISINLETMSFIVLSSKI